MKAIHILTAISLLLLVIACVPPAEELAGMNETESKTVPKEPEVEVKQEITVMPPKILENKTESNTSIENNTQNTTVPPITTAAQTQPPQVANSTIVYTGGAIEMGEGESAKIIVK
ncbi:hypothetical protein KY338_04455 [Candidatus Woesearchaeota archaeon]|nr:hypothetical protein [Candidatus Woesearchaeota archaeon]MBW3005767.1 hypothetical protein [Candidatus Woesearchaeota archaeon]